VTDNYFKVLWTRPAADQKHVHTEEYFFFDSMLDLDEREAYLHAHELAAKVKGKVRVYKHLGAMKDVECVGLCDECFFARYKERIS
jgi:hypothetical protein